jgi:hypothetical protein
MNALVLMAYDFSGKERDLTVGDINRPDFQEWFRAFEQGIARLSDGKLTHSTGTLMKEMVLRGPQQYDCSILMIELEGQLEQCLGSKEGGGTGTVV